jgi:hypothetical protein
MFTLSLERLHRVLRLKFTGLLTNDDLDRIDPTLVRVAGAEDAGPDMRCLFDLTGIEALAVPQSRFAERAAKPAIGGMLRVVVAPPWAGEDFGSSYRSARSLWSHAQPIVVATTAEAYRLLDIVAPRFEPAP